ncbi:MAG: hypothetical protein WD851_23445 [Pirellulales bacterium]
MATNSTDYSDSSSSIWPNVPIGVDLSAEEIASRLELVQQDPVLKLPARTPLGRELKRLRAEYLAKGGRLSTLEEIRNEVRERRGDRLQED